MNFTDILKRNIKKLTKSDIKVIVLTIIVIVGMLMPSSYIRKEAIHGKIIKVENNEGEKRQLSRSKVKVKILNGKYKDKVIDMDNLVSDKTYHETYAKKGNEVLINIEEDNKDNIKKAYIYEVVRYKYLKGIIILFLVLLSLLGGMQGIRSVLALLITTYSVLKILIPLIMSGFNPILVSIIICIGVSILNLLIISGKNKKSLAAIIGTLGGVMVAGIIALISSNILQVIGLTDEEAQMLIYITGSPKFNFRGLLFSGILMGALGAVMDISMSIASSMKEVKINNPDISKKQLVKAGFNVGRDIMGTMANTLILAYAGGAMYTLLLISSYKLPFERMLNQDVMAAEVIQALCGSIGLIFTIPITTLAVSLIGVDKE
ncbi:YibE/F family protein [Clostridium botulinum]|uniref:YibE/F family protein n=1 Tax=Clostridium botulinum TaxID=1491 RepID=A0AAU8YZZ9_CLOBO|nr:YibE/F family protein [Clostridium sporogenes]AVP65936.1 YibE/F family protein [Clostridium botulinum]MCF4016446.1 YibE/F family protein [Clostridium sporogenes]NFG03018.1 YibE/F family protein [Clostridium sporogenes]